jgi:cell division protein ZapA
MPSELTSVTVRIYGWDYTLKVEPSEVERAKQLAEYLDQRMQQIAKKSGTADTLKIAIRSAITIIDELFVTQAELEKLQQISQQPSQPQVAPEWEEKLHELSNRIERELQTL